MFLNIAAYRFVDLDDLPSLRERLRATGAGLGVRGTVLLAPEGINLFLSGPPADVRRWLDALRADPRFASLAPRESWSDAIGFNRYLVKCKREIITFRQPGARPAAGRAPAVAPATLARWLDWGCDEAGREIALLDTRNAFEVGVGTFAGAIDPAIAAFTDLPRALEAHRGRLAGRRIVTFCTGGIRCEKAALWMQASGFDDVVQLDGGVLGYFEAVGARHWTGELFVFDRRVSLRADLTPGSWRQDFESRDVHPACA